MTVRYVGTFLEDPLQVPVELLDYLAEQLEIADPSWVKAYAERDKTRLEHVWEIREADDWLEFSEVEDELAEWIEGRAWTTGGWAEGACSTPRWAGCGNGGRCCPACRRWPGWASRRDTATQRLWETLYALLSEEQKTLLDRLLEVAEGDRHSTLDKLRRPSTRVSGPAMIGALERFPPGLTTTSPTRPPSTRT